MLDQIHTIEGIFESKFKEKGSLFIGRAYPIKNEDDAREILAILRKEFSDATHICYAYCLSDGKAKYSDDGEPNGTAGIRILNAIHHFDLTNVFITSIRYYGGTKLGAGPLGKAYYKSAFDVLFNSIIKTKQAFYKAKFSSDYSNIKTLYKLLVSGKIIQSEYDESFFVEAYIPSSEYAKIIDDIMKITKGNAKTECDKTPFYLD